MNQLVARLADMLPVTVGPRVEIALDLAATSPVFADLEHVELALMNLVKNACDAMPAGGTITINTANLTTDAEGAPSDLAPGEYVAVSVKDTGVGMTPEVLSHAFEPFFTTKRIGAGTGLGLSTVYRFVKKAHGCVTLKSRPGVGTTVTLFLPSAGDARLPAARLPDVRAQEARANRACRILLVDDDPDVGDIIAESLRAEGHSVRQATSGGAALDTIDSEAFDLVITDYAMPGMSGGELARRIDERTSALPVLLITGVIPPSVKLPDGITVLVKPFPMAQLFGAIATLTEGPSAYAAGESGRLAASERTARWSSGATA
jgi:CheY-like chemotaxis protein